MMVSVINPFDNRGIDGLLCADMEKTEPGGLKLGNRGACLIIRDNA